MKGQTAAAPILVGLGSIAGGYLGGVMTGKSGPTLSLLWPLLCLSAALPGLWWFHGEAASLTLMLFCGMGYGILISVIPAVIQQSCGAERFAALFGMVFTAWGLAGLCGPAVAGLIFDHTASCSGLPLSTRLSGMWKKGSPALQGYKSP